MNSKVIMVTGGKGGTGKTTSTISFAAALNELGVRTLEVEMEMELPKMAATLQADKVGKGGLMQYVNGDLTLEEVVSRKDIEGTENLFFISSSGVYSSEQAWERRDEIKQAIDRLKEKFDYILIDCPAGAEYGFQLSAYLADEAIAVLNPQAASIKDATTIIGSLIKNFGMTPDDIHLLYNKYEHSIFNKSAYSIDNCDNALLNRCNKLGLIPYDKKVLRANEVKDVVTRYFSSKAGACYKLCAKRFLNPEIPLDVFDPYVYGTVWAFFRNQFNGTFKNNQKEVGSGQDDEVMERAS